MMNKLLFFAINRNYFNDNGMYFNKLRDARSFYSSSYCKNSIKDNNDVTLLNNIILNIMKNYDQNIIDKIIEELPKLALLFKYKALI